MMSEIFSIYYDRLLKIVIEELNPKNAYILNMEYLENMATYEQKKHAFYVTKKYLTNLISKLGGTCGTYEEYTHVENKRVNSSTYAEVKTSKTHLEKKNYRGISVDLFDVLNTLNNRQLKSIINHNNYAKRKNALSKESEEQLQLFSIRRFNVISNSDGNEENEVNTISSRFRTPEEELIYNSYMEQVKIIIDDIKKTDLVFHRVYDILQNDISVILTDNTMLQVLKRFKHRHNLELLSTEDLQYLFS